MEKLYCSCNENKGADSCVVTMHLICAFVVAYARSRFSHDLAQILMLLCGHN